MVKKSTDISSSVQGQGSHGHPFLSPQVAFLSSLYLETTDAMLKIKCASKGSFKLYKAIFTLVLDCVLFPLCVNSPKNRTRDCNLCSNIFMEFMRLSAPRDAQKFRTHFYSLHPGKADSF